MSKCLHIYLDVYSRDSLNYKIALIFWGAPNIDTLLTVEFRYYRNLIEVSSFFFLFSLEYLICPPPHT
jgi:hypothetical protein